MEGVEEDGGEGSEGDERVRSGERGYNSFLGRKLPCEYTALIPYISCSLEDKR